MKPNALHLFQGDSITDAGRVREPGQHLGGGYAFLTAALYQRRHGKAGARFLNRGLSGNRVKELEARWTDDGVALQPDSLSILIGINDTWRRYDRNDPTSTEDYAAGYRRLLDRTARETKARIILMEPFLLPVNDAQLVWWEDLRPKQAVVRQLAVDYGLPIIPLQEVFNEAARASGPAAWAADGVHPTPAGHQLIAEKLLPFLENI